MLANSKRIFSYDAEAVKETSLTSKEGSQVQKRWKMNPERDCKYQMQEPKIGTAHEIGRVHQEGSVQAPGLWIWTI